MGLNSQKIKLNRELIRKRNNIKKEKARADSAGRSIVLNKYKSEASRVPIPAIDIGNKPINEVIEINRIILKKDICKFNECESRYN